jgi:alkyl hydroperoxide reductase subunit F
MSFSFNINTTSITTPKLDETILYDHLVLGGGPAGYNAALYAFRKGLKTAILTQHLGGQLLNTSIVDNYLGLVDISGEGLSEAFIHHLKQYKIPIIEDVIVKKIEKMNHVFHITTQHQTYKAKTILLATGSHPRRLEIPGEDTFSDKGVAYCAICDAPLFKNKTVIIAGGGNSAVEASLDVAKWAKEVIVVHRSEFRADKVLLDQMMNHPKIIVFKQTQILEVLGESRMTSIRVLDKVNQSERIIEADGLFVEIGNIPNSSLVKDLVKLSDSNHVMVDHHQHTSLPGLFAAGDVCDSPYKQIVIAVAQGAVAALAASEYINQQGGIYAFNE